MKKIVSVVLLCASAWVQAAPTEPDYAAMEHLLAERGLISSIGTRLGQARETVSTQASELVMRAMGLLGVPYQYGGNTVETGLDCSGLVRLVYEESLGKILPRRAADQAAATQTIDRKELKPGDLVFFNTMRRAFSHVGIYVGEGKFIHAPRTGAHVRIEDMRTSYWSSRFNGARRVPLNDTAATAVSIR